MLRHWSVGIPDPLQNLAYLNSERNGTLGIKNESRSSLRPWYHCGLTFWQWNKGKDTLPFSQHEDKSQEGGFINTSGTYW